MKNRKYTYKNIKSIKRLKEFHWSEEYYYWKIVCEVDCLKEKEIVFYDYTHVSRKEAIRKFLRDINRNEQSVMCHRFRPTYELRYGSYESRYGCPEPNLSLNSF